MIFDSIVLHNFGAYAGRHTVDLSPPSPDRPIILVGGVNGGGKTTLLDALQLVLYGKLARCSNRGNLAYKDYLQKCINRDADPTEGAALEIELRHVSAGSEHRIRVHRSWADKGKGIREHVEVLRDGEQSRLYTERWQEFVEEFLPVRIAHLFLFDGEQIEAFADPATSAEVLSSAIRSLLGLDIVDQLSTDLIALERRQRTKSGVVADSDLAETFAAKLESLEEERRTITLERGAATNNLERLQKRLREEEAQFRSDGGDLYEQREELSRRRAECDSRLHDAEDALRELAHGPAPFLLVPDLLASVVKQSELEEASREIEAVSRVLGKRDSWLLSRIRKTGLDKSDYESVKVMLKKDREDRRSKARSGSFLRFDIQTKDLLNCLVHGGLQAASSRRDELLASIDQAQKELEAVERLLAAVPDEDRIAKLIASVDDLRYKVAEAEMVIQRLDADAERVSRETDHYQTRLEAALRRAAHDEFLRRDAKRILVHSSRAREKLVEFRSAVVRRHVSRLEQFILDSFRQLLWKQSLVSDISIDPETYNVVLKGGDGGIRPQARLSAGERQLLALAMLWGLARASGLNIPVVIDTPMGRLDGAHKLNLVTKYFPEASHQVLLLSTDEEVDETFYDQIRPHIGRAYRLIPDDPEGSTHVEDGYFWGGAS